MEPNEIEQVQETHTETEREAGSSEDHEEGNPWPHLKEHFSFKQRRGDSVIMECKLCVPKRVEVAAYKNSASNLRKHVMRKHPLKITNYNMLTSVTTTKEPRNYQTPLQLASKQICLK